MQEKRCVEQRRVRVMYKVALANARTFDAADGVSLLDAAAAAGVVLEYSCRNGRCGVCKTRLQAGATKLMQQEESLTADEAEAGFILTCCRSASADIQLETEDLGFLAGIERKTLPCRIDSIELVAARTLRVVLRLPPTAGFAFVPGQYIDVIGPAGLRRSYSLANAPREDGRLELYIAGLEDGRMSHYWFTQAAVNDLLRLEGPFGTFCLRDSLPQQLIFMATGTGLAPVKALLEQLDSRPAVAPEKMRFYWGLRHADDICWQPSLRNIEVEFVPVLSRAGQDWQGRRGHVQQAVAADFPDLSEAAIFACGAPGMIEAARSLSARLGLPRQYFFSDAFVSST